VDGTIFVANGDIAQIGADAVGYSASTWLTPDGNLYPAFASHIPGFAELFAALPRPCHIGDTFWLPLAGPGQPRGVVVVAAAGGTRTLGREKKITLSVRQALSRAIEALRQVVPPHERLLVALPTFRQGLGGDQNARLASARAQIATVHEVLQQQAGVDVVFVTYTADSYRIFLQARRERQLTPACPLEESSLAALVDALREQRCVLFAGAGLSAGAGLPGWSPLIEQLAGDLGIPCPAHPDLDYYLDLAQWYVEARGAAELAGVIGRLFGAAPARPTLAHYLLTSLPVRVIITTNYDDLLERALTALRKYPDTIVEQSDVVRTAQPEGVCVVKLHGDARRQKGIVLSRDDYDAFFRNRPAHALLLEGLLLNQTFLFVGYGLKDPNFRQIYSRIAGMLEGAKREAFALTVEAGTASSPLLIEQWRRKGLHLLAMPGQTLQERIHASWRLLDWLADRVTLNAPDLFLASDVPGTGPLQGLRRLLIEEVGREVEENGLRCWPEGEARHLAEVLAFLTRHGWRPDPRSGVPLWQLWARLADAFGTVADRRRMLIKALQHTERFDDAQEVRQRLARLEGTK
jgi:hypothetical protein